MAVSGLHFGILYMIVFWLLSKGMSILRLPYGCIALSTMVIMFIFVFITGASFFSAVRAFVMVLLHQISILVRRRYDLWNALGFVSLLSILYNPFVVWNVGFQLSFWAVFFLLDFTVR